MLLAILIQIAPLKGDEAGKIVILGEWNFQDSYLQCRDITYNAPSRIGFYWRSGGSEGSRQGENFEDFAKLIRALDKFESWNTVEDNKISIPWDQDFVADFSASGVTLNFSKERKHAIKMGWKEARLVATAIEEGVVRVQSTAPKIMEQAQQGSTGQPATRPELKSEGSDKPQPEAEGRSR